METPPGTPATDTPGGDAPPAADAPPADAPVGDAPASGDQPPADDGTAAAASADAKPAKAPKGKKDEPPPAPEPKRGPDVTARLAALSRDNRETRKALRTAENAAATAAARAGEFDALIAKAQRGDDTAIEEVFQKFGFDFTRVVNHFAGKGDEPTPEQKRDREIADLRAKYEANERRLAEEAQRQQVAQAEGQRQEMLGGIAQTIQKQADKFEICARLGEEAANDVLTEVSKAWEKSGRHPLEPGEYEDAVDKAIEFVELQYEERGKKLMKGAAKANGANGHANGANGAAKVSLELPANLAGGKLSDKDEDIIAGLIDKTAPGASSQRNKPRTINSSLGGSAPPKQPATGAMDPREALRQVLAPFQR